MKYNVLAGIYYPSQIKDCVTKPLKSSLCDGQFCRIRNECNFWDEQRQKYVMRMLKTSSQNIAYSRTTHWSTYLHALSRTGDLLAERQH